VVEIANKTNWEKLQSIKNDLSGIYKYYSSLEEIDRQLIKHLSDSVLMIDNCIKFIPKEISEDK